MTPIPAMLVFLIALTDLCPHCGKVAPADSGLDVRSAYPVGKFCPCCWGRR